MAKYVIEDTTLTGIADAIRAKTGSTDPIPVTDMAAQIAAITGGGSGDSGSVEGIVYVTFMNGDEELCKTACMKGDSTVDPVEDGKIAVPTKEPTVSTVYTYAGGWALTDGGEADIAALVDVSEDRTVYAAYNESVREYTVNFYDDDGTTLLESLQVAYGTVPNPAEPEKEGYYRSAWSPELVAVTGDADYVAVWTELSPFQRFSLAEISEICEAGDAESYFAVGDTRTFTGTDGNTYTMYIIGLNADPKSDGSGYAGMTFAIVDASRGALYSASAHAATAKDFYTNIIPDELKAVMKTLAKQTYYRSSSSWSTSTPNGKFVLSTVGDVAYFEPSALECGVTGDSYTNGGYDATHEGLAVAAYPGLATQAERAKLGTSFFTRTTNQSGSYTYHMYYDTSGAMSGVASTNTLNFASVIVCGCI